MTGGAASRWSRIGEVIAGALERPPAERMAFLDATCGSDPELRREVESLLRAHARSGAMDRLGTHVAPVVARLQGIAEPLVGRTIGRYRILEPVGGGGMGVVYRAVDTQLDRTVALKFLQSRVDPGDSAAERFRREARTVAALEHPNICSVYEIGESDDGHVYLVMPLYDGETLQARIARGRLPVESAVDIAMQIARALAKAHAHGIVHRDIKPSNVFITTDGVVKLLDFGIAKLVDVTLTATGGPLGTIAYMSPEQAQGERVDHRSDLWSLGVVLYEMLAGERPFAGSAAGAVLQQLLHRDPAPLSAHRDDVPPALDRIVTTALARSPAARYASAQVMETDLEALGLGRRRAGGAADGAVPGAGPPSSRRRAPTARDGGTDAPARRRVLAMVAIAMLLVIGVAGAWFTKFRPASSGTGAPTHTTIAVLPFADRSPNGDEQYLSDGISEELTAMLARIPELRVSSRTTAFSFRGRDEDLQAIGERLGVSVIVTGSVRRSGNRLRISAQLVDVQRQFYLWNETYDRDAGDAFTVQQDIAAAIARKLRVQLVGSHTDSAGITPGAAAYDLYLKGRYAWYTRTDRGLRDAARYFEQAIAVAPAYARAHAGLADAYAVLGFYDYLPPDSSFPRAEAAAQRAIALDPGLATPHATLGYVDLYYHWNLTRAEDEFRRSIDLDPSYSTAHQWYGNLLTAAGRFPDAERELRKAGEIDPLSLIASAALGWVLYHAGRAAEAVAQCDATLALNPQYAVAHLWRGWALQELDSLPAAVEAHRRALAVSDSSALYVASLARSLALAGNRAEAQRLLDGLLARGHDGRYVAPYEVAKVYEALGRADDALTSLERAYRERSHSMVFLRVDPQLARLRSHPRFVALVGKIYPI